MLFSEQGDISLCDPSRKLVVLETFAEKVAPDLQLDIRGISDTEFWRTPIHIRFHELLHLFLKLKADRRKNVIGHLDGVINERTIRHLYVAVVRKARQKINRGPRTQAPF
nr:hypothetical protein [Salinibacter ruber]